MMRDGRTVARGRDSAMLEWGILQGFLGAMACAALIVADKAWGAVGGVVGAVLMPAISMILASRVAIRRSGTIIIEHSPFRTDRVLGEVPLRTDIVVCAQHKPWIESRVLAGEADIGPTRIGRRGWLLAGRGVRCISRS